MSNAKLLTLELLFSERSYIRPNKNKRTANQLQHILVDVSEMKAEKHSALTISYSPGNFSQHNSSTFFKLYKTIVWQRSSDFYNRLTSNNKK